jgi:hypothetical protein
MVVGELALWSSAALRCVHRVTGVGLAGGPR